MTMASEDNVEPTIPQVAPIISADLMEALRAQAGTGEAPPDNVADTFVQPPVKRKRGRPRKYPVSETGTTVPELMEESTKLDSPLPPAKLGKRDEREVAERIANILMGGTGIASQAKDYLAMTEDEAKAIADPLSSYLVRNADTIPIAGQILENYDLLAITLGVLAYSVRIYRDRTNELAEARTNTNDEGRNGRRSLAEVVGQHTTSTNNGQEQGSTNFISTPYGT